MTLLWSLLSLVIPFMLVLLALARGRKAPSSLVMGALAAGMVLGPMVAPFAIVAPFAARLGTSGSALASAWLESGFLEEFAKAAALWLLLVPHRLAPSAQARATGAVLISLGFGTYENLLHLADAADPGGLVLMRGLISLPAHLTAGLAAAVVLLCRPDRSPATAGCALLAAWFSHGTFNQWALAWAQALAGQALPDQAPLAATILLVAAPVATSLAAFACWRRLLPQVRGGSRVALPWSAATVLLLGAALAFLVQLAHLGAASPPLLLLGIPFAALPAALAIATGGLAYDAWLRPGSPRSGPRSGRRERSSALATSRMPIGPFPANRCSASPSGG